MKKQLSFLLALILCICSFTACSQNAENDNKDVSVQEGNNDGSPVTEKGPQELLEEKYSEPVTIKIGLSYRDSEDPETPDSVTPETSTAVKRFKEDLNIDLEYSWIVTKDQYDAKFGAELASGNLPDVMILTPTQFEDLVSQGALADLTEVWETYASDEIKSNINFDGNLLESGKRDGKIYGLPQGSDNAFGFGQMYYDMNKLKAAGITSYDQLPKTVDELEELLALLYTLDLDGDGKTGEPVLPANKYYFDGGIADFTPIFNAYGAWCGKWFDDGDGTLVSTDIQPQLADALTRLNDWYNKGYIAKDFAAMDIWAADSSLVTDIVAGEYAVMSGTWWIPNWPLNDHKKNDPDADWIVGPTLTLDGETPTVMTPRYVVSQYFCVSKDCKNPEALLKMYNWSLKYETMTASTEWQEQASEEELAEMHAYVYSWLPYRVVNPLTFRDNYYFINEKAQKGETVLAEGEALNGAEFWSGWDAYLKHVNGTEDAVSWGFYLSRIDPNGGLGSDLALFEKANILWSEVYVTTPSMVTMSGELNKYRDTTFLSMIMGETAISDFDKYVEKWKQLGGSKISEEVNEWYQNLQ